VLYANAAALQFSGLRREELTGRSVCSPSRLSPTRPSRPPAARRWNWGRPPSSSIRARAAGGSRCASTHPTGISLYLREINQRKRREAEREEYLQALRERVRLSESQEAVNQLVHSSLGIDAIIRRALDAGGAALAAEAASVELREAGNWFVRYQSGLTAEALGAELDDEEAPLPSAPPGQGARGHRGCGAEPAVDVGIIKHYGIRGCIVVPLVSQGEVYGCLLFHYRHPQQFTAAAIDYAKKLGSTVSLALENARLREREGESLHLGASLAEGLSVASSDNPACTPSRAPRRLSCRGRPARRHRRRQDTRQVYGMPGSVVALTVVIAGALAGSLVGVAAAAFGGVVFYLAVADSGAKGSPTATLISTAIWVAAAVISSLLASGFGARPSAAAPPPWPWHALWQSARPRWPSGSASKRLPRTSRPSASCCCGRSSSARR